MAIYMDGSQETDQKGTSIGAGTGLVKNGIDRWHGRRGISLGDAYKVYYAKAVALFEGLKEALKNPIAQVTAGIYICSDNLCVVCNAGQIPKGSRQGVLKKLRDAAQTWQ